MDLNTQFRIDVISGLSKPLKRLSSKYFYDEIGDRIFQEIMQLEEYYLPNAELEILQNQTLAMMQGFAPENFDVIELGAGDGSKTVYFLEQLLNMGKEFTYCPLDISPQVLKINKAFIKERLPGLKIKPVVGDYFTTISSIDPGLPKIILFMGSNIGNYENGAAIQFLKMIKKNMLPGDRLIVGIDLQKNPKIILKAYDDSQGVTKRFNLNLLERINRELNADFNTKAFDHYAFYNPLNGSTYSFLFSLKKQTVAIDGQEFHFKEGEVIHTEVSQKYNLKQIEEMQKEAGFRSVDHFLDKKKYFSVSVFA